MELSAGLLLRLGGGVGVAHDFFDRTDAALQPVVGRHPDCPHSTFADGLFDEISFFEGCSAFQRHSFGSAGLAFCQPAPIILAGAELTKEENA